MAHKVKPLASAPAVFSASKWASLDEAFSWAEGALGSSALAEEDLTERFRDGQLPIAMRHGDKFELLEPSLRKRLWVAETEEGGVLTIRVWGLPAEIASSAPHFFVAREPLENLYSPGPAIEPASDAAAEASTAPTRNKPGPQPIKDWKTVVARELIRRAYAGEKKPTPSAMVRFCQNTIDHSPDLSDMAKWLKQLL
jgi:hypothetical protein